MSFQRRKRRGPKGRVGRNSEDIRSPAAPGHFPTSAIAHHERFPRPTDPPPPFARLAAIAGRRRQLRARGGNVYRLTAIPTSPDWEAEDDRGTVIEEFTELVFIVAASDCGSRAGHAPAIRPLHGHPLGRQARTYALLAKKGLRPWSLDATGTNYFLRMKWVKA